MIGAKDRIEKKSDFVTGRPAPKHVGNTYWPASYVEFLVEFGSGMMTTEDLPSDSPSTKVGSFTEFRIFSPFESIARFNLHYFASIATAEAAMLSDFRPETARLGYWEGDLIPIGRFDSRRLICFQNSGWSSASGSSNKEWTVSVYEAPFTVEHLKLTFEQYIDGLLQGRIEIPVEDPTSCNFYWYPLYREDELSEVTPQPSIESSWSDTVDLPGEDLTNALFGEE